MLQVVCAITLQVCVCVCVCVVIYYIHGGSQAPGGPIWSKVQGENDDDDDELETGKMRKLCTCFCDWLIRTFSTRMSDESNKSCEVQRCSHGHQSM